VPFFGDHIVNEFDLDVKTLIPEMAGKNDYSGLRQLDPQEIIIVLSEREERYEIKDRQTRADFHRSGGFSIFNRVHARDLVIVRSKARCLLPRPLRSVEAQTRGDVIATSFKLSWRETANKRIAIIRTEIAQAERQ
jgi:hypothetical protein